METVQCAPPSPAFASICLACLGARIARPTQKTASPIERDLGEREGVGIQAALRSALSVVRVMLHTARDLVSNPRGGGVGVVWVRFVLFWKTGWWLSQESGSRHWAACARGDRVPLTMSEGSHIARRFRPAPTSRRHTAAATAGRGALLLMLAAALGENSPVSGGTPLCRGTFKSGASAALLLWLLHHRPERATTQPHMHIWRTRYMRAGLSGANDNQRTVTKGCC